MSQVDKASTIPLKQHDMIYVFGAGPVSQRLVSLAATVGFRAVVLDIQAELADRERFPAAGRVVVLASFEQVLAGLEIDPTCYLVIATPEHAHDKTVLIQALRTEAGYIGLLCSKPDRNALYETLVREGFTLDDLARVHSPIGLPIGSKSPEEIAVSIVAELIQVRAERKRLSS